MKIESMVAPTNPQINNAKAEVAMSPRERAIAALMRPNTPAQAAAQSSQAQETPVSNPSQISPEEMGAIRSSSKPTQSAEKSGQDYNNEAPASEVSAESKTSSEPLSAQYAILARKEKALRQKEQQLKAREAALTAPPKAPEVGQQEPKVDLSKFVDKDRLVKDPFTVLNELGLSYDQLTELALNAPRAEELQMMNEIRSLKEELKALRGETESTKKSFEETQKQQYDQAITQIRNEAKQLVKLDPQFETIKATGSINEVVELIERTFNEDGILLTVEEAAQQVESYLVDEAIKLAKLAKIQQKIAPKPQAPVTQKATSQSEQPQLKTLTNSVSSSRKLNARERAILAMEGKLK